MPTREQVEQAVRQVEMLRAKHHGRIVIDAVVPDYYARFPKPCVGGWGRRSLNVTPAGKVLPCHAAEVIPGLEFWNVREHSLGDIWRSSPAFTAFRGTDWMQEPCKSCRAQGEGFRRLPLPGLPDRGRCPRRRPGVPSVAASCAGRATGRGARGSGLQLPAFLIAPAFVAARKCQTPDCNRRVKWWRLGAMGARSGAVLDSDLRRQAPPHQGGLR